MFSLKSPIIQLLTVFIGLISIGFTSALPVEKRTGTQPSLSGGAAVFGDGTYPRATVLANGQLLGVYTAFSNGNNVITTTLSTDGGNTWNNLGVVTSGVGDIDNPFLLQLTSGRILCAFRNHSLSGGVYTYFRITICYSDDNGATWAWLSQPASDPGPVNGNWEPFLRRSSENPNNVQIYYSRENAANDQDSLMRTSTDGGNTWSLAQTISGSGIMVRDGMLGVASLPFGANNLIAVFESDDTAPGGTGLFTIKSVTSNNDGASWGNRATVYTPTGSNNNANAPQIINVGGTMVVSLIIFPLVHISSKLTIQ